jgi:N-acetylmuramoyl-L-alanine amidase/Hemopexin
VRKGSKGCAYFFKKQGYVRYDIGSDLVDVGPAPISQFWTRLPAEFHSDIDAAVNWGNGKAYFFKGKRYVRYNVATDHVDVGPAQISEFWKHLPAEFHSKIGAAINWTFAVDLADLLRSAGLVVNEVGDWRRRVRPGVFQPVGIMIHHTGGRNDRQVVVDGRPDLRGPLANLYIDRAGVVHVVSGGLSNHAGSGAQQVLDDVIRDVAPTGTARQRGLRDTAAGNGVFYGFENENRGDGRDDWPEVQLDAMARAAAAICLRHCWHVNRVISHAEWTSRKVDPRGIDMNDFRARVERV